MAYTYKPIELFVWSKEKQKYLYEGTTIWAKDLEDAVLRMADIAKRPVEDIRARYEEKI